MSGGQYVSGGRTPVAQQCPATAGPVEPVRLLVIADNAGALALFRQILTPGPENASCLPRFSVDYVQDGEQACTLAREARAQGRPCALAFVGMRMPGGWDGMHTIEQIWRVDPAIHMVVCSAAGDAGWDAIADRLGLSDRLLMLRMPFEKVELLQLAGALSEKWRLHRAQQRGAEQLERSVAVRTEQLAAALAEREVAASALQFQATHDTLTGLANRNLLHDRLNQAIAYAARYDYPIWVAFLDLDRFKLINDTLGHKAGDLLLGTVADRLKSVLRETDTIARLGGDEFVLVLRGPEDGSLSTATLRRILEVIAAPTMLEGRSHALSCSVGVAVYPCDGVTAEVLIEHADIAMYRAKESGRGNFQFFTADMNSRLLERVHLEQALREAVAGQQFVLHYQPQLDLRSGRIIGTEALIRWNHPAAGVLAPARFVAVAEESGLIGEIGLWVLRTACAQNKAWQRAGLAPMPVAINLSARQLADRQLVAKVAAALKEAGLAAAFLEIDISESAVMADVDHSIGVLRELKALGVQLAIDDVGTGYSSLSYLKRFPIDVLKIDHSFVHEVASDPDCAAIVISIISLAHSLRLRVVAEGVETAAQLGYLRRHACDLMQGYYFSHPLAAADIDILLREQRGLPAAAAAAAHQATLLIVDDDALLLEMLALELQQDGYLIHTAHTAAQAFAVLAAHAVDVVLCDQRMPGMDGVQFLARIKRLYPATVRVMLSAHSESATVINAVNQGAIFSYFVKPCEAPVLRAGVRAAFRHQREAARAQEPHFVS